MVKTKFKNYIHSFIPSFTAGFPEPLLCAVNPGGESGPSSQARLTMDMALLSQMVAWSHPEGSAEGMSVT